MCQAFIQSPSSLRQDEIDTKIFADQVNILYQHSRKALIFNSINVLILAAALYGIAPHAHLWSWLGIMLLMTILRLAIAETYLRRGSGSTILWKRLFVLGAVCQGVGWGFMCPLFVFNIAPLYQALLFMVLGGMVAGASAFHSSFFSAYVAYTLPAILPAVTVLFLQWQDPAYLTMGILTSLFAIVMLTVVQRTSRILISNLRLKHENLKLMETTKENETRFRTLTESTASAIFILSENRFRYLNPTVEEYSGYSREDLLERDFAELVHPDDRALVLRNAAARLADDKDPTLPSRYEFRFLRRNGESRWVDFTPAIMTYKGVRSILGTAFDITDRKRVEQELAASEKRYRTLFDTAQDAMFLLEISSDGRSSRVLDVNDQACKKLGYTREEMLQFSNHEFDAAPDEGVGELMQTLRTHGHGVFERRHKTKDGHVFPVELNTHLIYHQDRVFSLSIARDITRRKEYEQKLLKASEQAESANRAKTEFLANMNHELRTPLNGVLGMLQLAKLTDLSEEQQEYIDTAMTSGSSLLGIINDILDLSKIEAGKLELLCEPFALRDVLKSVIKVFAVLNRKDGPTIRYEIDPDVPERVQADPGRLRQILFNLVGNAFKFTERGEVVTRVSMRKIDNGEDIALHFEVSDTGIGIPPDKLNDIFEPFSQAHAPRTGKSKGTGLGLSIVKRLVARMGGEVSARSKEGAGTTISFHILAHRETEQKPSGEKRALEDLGENSPCQVLIVEDDAINQLLASRFLEKAGHRVTVAATGAAALQLLAERPFDLALLDIQLPDMIGTEVARRIRSGESGALDPEIPIIALTAYTLDRDQQRLLSAGMNDCISKPLEMNRLTAAIGKVMAGRGDP